MLRINVHSQHPKHCQQYHQYIMNYLQHEKDIMICRRTSLQKRMLEWTKKIRKAISRVKLEDEAYHECNIEYLDQEDDDYKLPWKEDVADLRSVTYSSYLGEITFKKPAARKEPSKDTQTLKEPIRGSHLGKRLRQSESGSTNIDPVVTEFDFIGQGGPWAISRGTHTQSIIQGG